MTLTNEQKAHDLACAFMANPFFVQAYIGQNVENNHANIDVLSLYKELYDGYLSGLNELSDNN